MRRSGPGDVLWEGARVAALFDQRFDGDDALLRLAARHLSRLGLGAEMAPASPEQLPALMALAPPEPAALLAHLPRGMSLLRDDTRRWIAAFAQRAADRVHGLVVHDQRELATQPEAYRAAVAELDALLAASCGQRRPWLFIEYACGLDPALFVEFFAAIPSLQRTSACIDIGHIGIRCAQDAFAERHPEVDVEQLTPYDERLPALIGDLQQALAAALPAVIRTIEGIGALGKPLHFHLHDGHPLWMQSPYGVRDHSSFFQVVALPFDYRGASCVRTMYGPQGLGRIVAAALAALPAPSLSFTLEIHPVEGRQPLGQDEDLFAHWTEKTNAMKTRYWLAVLERNAELLKRALAMAARQT